MKQSKREPAFDPRAFLSKVGAGRTIAKYRANQVVFSQGDAADSVFFIEEGKVKVTVVSKQGKEAVIAILGTVLIRGQRPELRERSFLISRVSKRALS